jgi:GT2 family glycosyltransferase
MVDEDNSRDRDVSMAGTGLGVVIVAYNSADVVLECLESLLGSENVQLRIVVCDNASPDNTVEAIRSWASGETPFEIPRDSPVHGSPTVPKPVSLAEYPADRATTLRGDQLGRVTLLRSPRNLGFAGGVNLGLAALRPQPDIGLFWVLNPDCVVAPQTARAYVETAAASPGFALIGSRTVFYDSPERIQTDGGRVRRWTGVCDSVHSGRSAGATPLPSPESLDFISGANMVASRAFLERIGPLAEDYFLYYEEVDWAFRREDLPLILSAEALVYHHGGTTIGTGNLTRRPSAFANYFNYRNRIRFLTRFARPSIPTAYLYAMAKIAQLVLLGAWPEVRGALRGLHNLAPPSEVRGRIAPDAAELAFGVRKSTLIAEQHR